MLNTRLMTTLIAYSENVNECRSKVFILIFSTVWPDWFINLRIPSTDQIWTIAEITNISPVPIEKNENAASVQLEMLSC